MRQLVSLVKDGRVEYAVVDSDSGEMTTFASVTLPDPDRFGIHEAAVLGTNLIEAIGLNGPRPRKRVAAEPQLELEPFTGESSPPPRHETAREKHNRKQREAYAARKGGKVQSRRSFPGRGKPSAAQYAAMGRRHISDDEVMDVFGRPPRVLRQSDRRASLLSRDGWAATSLPAWFAKAVDNRFTKLMLKQRDGKGRHRSRAALNRTGTASRPRTWTGCSCPELGRERSQAGAALRGARPDGQEHHAVSDSEQHQASAAQPQQPDLQGRHPRG
jgi:hypothetical protein